MTSTRHAHTRDCPDRKAAEADRRQYEAAPMQRQDRLQALAQAEWFEWRPLRAC